MIYYFSGTGNTKFVADFLADRLGDEVVSMNTLIKEKKNIDDRSRTPVVFAAPIYAWRYPLVVENLIKNAKINRNKKVYFIATCESQYGKTDVYLKKIAESISVTYMGFAALHMPNNYIFGGKIATPEETDEILTDALPELEKIAHKIQNNRKLSDKNNTPVAFLMSGAINTAMYKFMVSSKNFKVSDKCISCGKCEKVCPMNNIKMEKGEPVFGENCTWCFGCIERCPKKAIDIKGKTEGKRRSVCPEYKVWIKKKKNENS